MLKIDWILAHIFTRYYFFLANLSIQYTVYRSMANDIWHFGNIAGVMCRMNINGPIFSKNSINKIAWNQFLFHGKFRTLWESSWITRGKTLNINKIKVNFRGKNNIKPGHLFLFAFFGLFLPSIPFFSECFVSRAFWINGKRNL